MSDETPDPVAQEPDAVAQRAAARLNLYRVDATDADFAAASALAEQAKPGTPKLALPVHPLLRPYRDAEIIGRLKMMCAQGFMMGEAAIDPDRWQETVDELKARGWSAEDIVAELQKD